MANTEAKIDVCFEVGGKQIPAKIGREFIIPLALSHSNNFPPLALPSQTIPNHLKAIPHPLVLLDLIVDTSFKLYLKYHTESERDLRRVCAYNNICDYLEMFYKGNPAINPSWEIMLIKMAYPLLGDDTVLEDREKFFKAVVTHDDTVTYDPAFLFIATSRLNNYFATGSMCLMQFLQPRIAQSARRTETSEDWMYLGPIFKACAAEIKSEFTADQRGKIFTKYFDEKLERQLKIHGEWEKKAGESDSYTRTRIRKAYFRRFNDWMKRREKADRDLEAKIVETLEQTFWNKSSTEQVIAPLLNQIAKLNCSPDELEGYLNQMQEFAKGIKLE